MRCIRSTATGNTYELQTFECRRCGYEIERSADRNGDPHLGDAAATPALVSAKFIASVFTARTGGMRLRGGDRFGINRRLENFLSGIVEDRNIPHRSDCGRVN